MVKVLFVCHGNICRSVSAQYILQDMVSKAGLAGSFLIDSAATSTEEIGNPIYPPMRKALTKAGIPIGTHTARQLRRSDLQEYDFFIGFDEENLFYMRQILGRGAEEKIHSLTENIIEDPWYTRRFDECTRRITEGCREFFDRMVSGGGYEDHGKR